MTATELAERRKALGLSQYALGKRLGVNATTIRRWENGENHIDKPLVLWLALWAIEHGAPSTDPRSRPTIEAEGRNDPPIG